MEQSSLITITSKIAPLRCNGPRCRLAFYVGVKHKSRVILLSIAILISGCSSIKKSCIDKSHEYDILDKVNPLYPRAAYDSGIEGWATVSFTIATDGKPTDFKIIAGKPEGVFDAVSIQAVKSSKFRPRLIDCKYREVNDVQLRFSFELANK